MPYSRAAPFVLRGPAGIFRTLGLLGGVRSTCMAWRVSAAATRSRIVCCLAVVWRCSSPAWQCIWVLFCTVQNCMGLFVLDLWFDYVKYLMGISQFPHYYMSISDHVQKYINPQLICNATYKAHKITRSTLQNKSSSLLKTKPKPQKTKTKEHEPKQRNSQHVFPRTP